MAGRDRFLDLPDGLICTHILTKLPLEEVIRCSAVSRRWKRFWTLLPTLRFTDEFFNSIKLRTHARIEDRYISPIEFDHNAFERIINNILLLHSEDIEAFELYTVWFLYDKICQWILYLASKGVREITLRECDNFCLSEHDMMDVPSALFSCDKLVYLSLENFDLRRTPDYFGGFQCLTTFHVINVTLDGEAFELLVKLCPLLETVMMLYCRVCFTDFKIVSQRLKTLHIKDVEIDPEDYFMASCPQLTKLVIDGCLPRTELEINCPLLAQLHLGTKIEFLEGTPILKSLRKLILRNWHDDLNILSKFPNIEELCIGCWDHLPQALELKESKLKELHIACCSLENIAGLSHFLRSTTSLQSVTISLKGGFNSVDEQQFVNRLFIGMSPMPRVILSQPKCRNCKEMPIDGWCHHSSLNSLVHSGFSVI